MNCQKLDDQRNGADRAPKGIASPILADILIGLAIPTILLYEVSIWAARLIERDQVKQKLAREKQEAADEVAEKKPADASST